MKISFTLLVALGFAIPHHAHGAVIYREVFGATTDQAPLNSVGWSALGGATGTAPANNSLSLSSNANGGKPKDLDNINAGGPAASTSIGFVFNTTAANAFVFTNEYTVDRSVYGLTSFSIYAGNTTPVDATSYRFAVQIGGDWYVTTDKFANTVSVAAAGNFGNAEVVGGTAGSQQVAFNFTSAASAWQGLNVNPGIELSLGSVLGADLPGGNITGFGLYVDETGGTRRFDTFEINAIPEPASIVSLAFGSLLLTGRRRR